MKRWMAWCVGIIAVIAVAGIALAVRLSLAQPDTRPTNDQLDVVSYKAPPWASERISDCWLMADRRNHRKYWLLKIDGQWLGLDAGEVTE